ncbi:inner centromere protein A-like [Rhea pennata]|uniref:inner centromere protein A-like n=1 Tax=Rhea pennata TaxID=8795 RepID=UPI002E25C766
MAEADGPMRLLEVCGQRLSRFLHDAKHKHLAWLREAEEQGMRLLDSNFGAEPELVPKTPSQRRRPKKRQSSSLKDENKEPTRRRLSRRRSSIKLVSSKPGSQKRHSKEQTQNSSSLGEEVSAPNPAVRSQANFKAELPALPAALTGKWPAEEQVPVAKTDCNDCPQVELGKGDGADTEHGACKTVAGEQSKGAGITELPRVLSVSVVPSGQTAREGEETPKRRGSTSTPKAARNGDSAADQGDRSPQGLEKVLFQDSNTKMTTMRAKTRHCSGRRSFVGGPHKSHRASLAEKYSLASKRESMIRRSISRAISKKAAARESSSASSRASCQSSMEVFVEDDVTSSVRTRSCKQAMGVTWDRQQPGGRALSPLEDKHVNSANQTVSSASPASKVVRPLKNFLQAVQRNQLLTSPGSTGRGGVIRNFIKRNTPTRPDLKGDFVERERQRLESLRKKQEAEEQRKKKVEEEKRRRQAEMKQKREERLKKALQARERVEQMEEEKKKRMEQRILQNDEKVRPSQVREEKVVEERSKKKLSKKAGEADARKQKALRMEEDEFEQQELLQKRREDEVKERGKKVLELKNLVEQRQVEQVKERDHKQQGKEKAPPLQLELAVFTGKNIKEEESPKELQQLLGQEKRGKQSELIAMSSNTRLKVVKEEISLQESQQQTGEEKKGKQPESVTTASSTWLSKTVKKSISTSCLGPPKGSRSPKVSENNYGMDLNSDDSTDDENEPRKPVPAWADGSQLNQAILHQYYHPVNIDQLFGLIASPKLEDIFGKNKPRYFKRTSSAVWHSPPGTKPACGTSCIFKN